MTNDKRDDDQATHFLEKGVLYRVHIDTHVRSFYTLHANGTARERTVDVYGKFLYLGTES